jgi:outer membrane lipoprotein LolB
MPAPGAYAALTTDDQNRLIHLKQSGWDINYERYQSVAGSHWPAKLRLAAADVSVRLIIDNWQVDSADTGP